MARIRTIKPEFPQSESIGRLGREARLLFVQLWTIADDAGRTRAASRMLASLLYPYDDDAAELMDGWLGELQREGMVRLYEHDGARYLEICKWLEHQKIDRPSKSRLPEPREDSRIVASVREASTTDLGPRTSTKDLGPGAAPPPDVASLAFDAGVRVIAARVGGERTARSMVGKWRKDHGDAAVIDAIGQCQRAGPSEPISFITAILNRQRAQAPPKRTVGYGSQPG